MNAAYELAKLFKERENPTPFRIMEGEVVQLPEIKISIGNQIVLERDMIRSLVNLFQQNQDGVYLWLGKRVYLLPLSNSAAAGRFLVLGGDAI